MKYRNYQRYFWWSTTFTVLAFVPFLMALRTESCLLFFASIGLFCFGFSTMLICMRLINRQEAKVEQIANSLSSENFLELVDAYENRQYPGYVWLARRIETNCTTDMWEPNNPLAQFLLDDNNYWKCYSLVTPVERGKYIVPRGFVREIVRRGLKDNHRLFL